MSILCCASIFAATFAFTVVVSHFLFNFSCNWYRNAWKHGTIIFDICKQMPAELSNGTVGGEFLLIPKSLCYCPYIVKQNALITFLQAWDHHLYRSLRHRQCMDPANPTIALGHTHIEDRGTQYHECTCVHQSAIITFINIEKSRHLR